MEMVPHPLVHPQVTILQEVHLVQSLIETKLLLEAQLLLVILETIYLKPMVLVLIQQNHQLLQLSIQSVV
jgi:hypothetical protein